MRKTWWIETQRSGTFQWRGTASLKDNEWGSSERSTLGRVLDLASWKLLERIQGGEDMDTDARKGSIENFASKGRREIGNSWKWILGQRRSLYVLFTIMLGGQQSDRYSESDSPTDDPASLTITEVAPGLRWFLPSSGSWTEPPEKVQAWYLYSKTNPLASSIKYKIWIKGLQFVFYNS